MPLTPASPWLSPLAPKLPRTQRVLTAKDTAAVRAMILPTWQTAAAIAQHAGVPARTAVSILKTNATAWRLETRLCRIDGHNEVWLCRLRPMQMVLGVAVPVDPQEVETDWNDEKSNSAA